jgi:hypothetical protein
MYSRRQTVPPKRCYFYTRLYGILFHKRITFNLCFFNFIADVSNNRAPAVGTLPLQSRTLHQYTRWCSAEQGTRGGAVGWGTTLQAGRLRVRCPMVSMEYFINIIFLPHCGPGIDSTSNGNKYQQYLLWVKAPSCADCWEIWDPQGLYRDCFTFTVLSTEERECAGFKASQRCWWRLQSCGVWRLVTAY